MTLTIQALATVLPVLHLITALLYGMEFAGPKAPRSGRWRVLALWATLFAALSHLWCHWVQTGHFPVADTFVSLELLATSLVIVYMAVEVFSRTVNSGVFVFAVTFVLQLIASAFGPRVIGSVSTFAQSRFFIVHVTTIVASLAAILLSGFYGALYLVLWRQMREKRYGVLFRKLPDLETLSNMNRGAATAGFLFMTLGLNLGIWWAHDVRIEGFSYADPKVLSVMILWAMFGLIGLSRWVHFLSGRRAAMVAVGGLSLVVVSFVISLLSVGFHSFGR